MVNAEPCKELARRISHNHFRQGLPLANLHQSAGFEHSRRRLPLPATEANLSGPPVSRTVAWSRVVGTGPCHDGCHDDMCTICSCLMTCIMECVLLLLRAIASKPYFITGGPFLKIRFVCRLRGHARPAACRFAVRPASPWCYPAGKYSIEAIPLSFRTHMPEMATRNCESIAQVFERLPGVKRKARVGQTWVQINNLLHFAHDANNSLLLSLALNNPGSLAPPTFAPPHRPYRSVTSAACRASERRGPSWPGG